MNIGYCKDCKHRNDETEHCKLVHVQEDFILFGVYHDKGFDCYLEVADDFGCIHFTPRKE